MKLINKTQRIYLVLVVALLLVWSIIFMVGIFSVIEENIDETLHSELQAMVNQVTINNLPIGISTQPMEIIPISNVIDTTIAFSDTTLFNSVEQETFPYRQVRTQRRLGAQAYQITLRRSMVEYDDLFQAILVMELMLVLLLLTGLFMINKKILQRLWSPFYDTLKQVTGYEMGRHNNLKWEATEIDEFKQLNEVLQQMIKQIEQEYKSLKQFTENAAHEIQTPLSVISNKVELLLQDDSITQTQGRQLTAIQQTAGKLSRLNRALLKLTKIENEGFRKTVEVPVSELLKSLVLDYREVAKAENIVIYDHIEPNIYLNINPDLVELMFRNLLGNAIKHNIEGGYVKLSLNAHSFHIRNTGNVPIKNPDTFFERFQKGQESSKSLGLGLSIVAAIAKANDFAIAYYLEGDLHHIKLSYN